MGLRKKSRGNSAESLLGIMFQKKYFKKTNTNSACYKILGGGTLILIVLAIGCICSPTSLYILLFLKIFTAMLWSSYYYPHITDEETGAQKQIICPILCIQEVPEPCLNLGSQSSKAPEHVAFPLFRNNVTRSELPTPHSHWFL